MINEQRLKLAVESMQKILKNPDSADMSEHIMGFVDAYSEGFFNCEDLEEVNFPGLNLIQEERIRQIEKEGFDEKHDEQHHCFELIRAAIAYAANAITTVNFKTNEVKKLKVYEHRIDEDILFREVWPVGWDEEWDKRDKTDQLRSLVKAGALIAADIDRRLKSD